MFEKHSEDSFMWIGRNSCAFTKTDLQVGANFCCYTQKCSISLHKPLYVWINVSGIDAQEKSK